ncbi:Bax inhibitor-1/YccA family protein [Vagococcus coleopterorum]|uniref:Bax inhibitor-1/YccA family protein n=1 Tax=Vagococcus coleopterorum TaxID=2714946 RepID=A0A6G8AN82_9ENTE|nr:Bax inhibitor-1/YccA family protein [Vagococcus coleopterorum]QIL46430.1 Bax inhibitor-1/YccA family protein [Vagococcus coleopterorum]
MNEVNYGTTTTQSGLATFFARVYAYVGLGIAVSAVTSYLVTNVFAAQVGGYLMQHPMLLILMPIIEIALVIYLSAKSLKNPAMAMAAFVAYSAINGVVLSLILAQYTEASVTKAFVAAAVTYGVTAIVGVRTKKELSGVGHAMRSALIGLIVVMLINIFVGSSAVDMFIGFAMIIIFSGLTAYDHQTIKKMYYQVGDSPQAKGIAINCAMQLYLDFINLLLAFLRIFGSRD